MDLPDFYDFECIIDLEEDGDIDAFDAGLMMGFLSA